jgi:hypothetical protein
MYTPKSAKQAIHICNVYANLTPYYDIQVALPAEAKAALERRVHDNELREDGVICALEWAHKVAAWADLSRSSNTVSWEMPLVKCSITPPECIRNELGSTENAKQAVCVKHLNALQEFLAGLLQIRPESSLPAAYRTELPNKQAYMHSATQLAASDRRVLFRRLVAYVTHVLRNACSPDWSLSDCLENVPDDSDLDDDDLAQVLAPVEGLFAKHIYHALDVLRAVGLPE